MTLYELCEELQKITYGESTEELSELAPIVNMSLSRLYSDKKISSVYSFYQSEILPIERPLSFHKKGGEDLTLPLKGRAYGMHLSGQGVFRITVGKESEEVEFDTRGEFFAGFISGEGDICFTGDNSYDVYSLSFYDEVLSGDVSDIPSGYPRRYSLSDMIPDFAYPLSMPKGDGGVEIDGADYIGGELFIPPDYSGRIVIEYSKMPTRVSALLPDKDIGIEAKHLTSLLHLTAYYALLEGERELAEKHLDAYLALAEPSEPAPMPREEVAVDTETEYPQSAEYVIEDRWA